MVLHNRFQTLSKLCLTTSAIVIFSGAPAHASSTSAHAAASAPASAEPDDGVRYEKSTKAGAVKGQSLQSKFQTAKSDEEKKLDPKRVKQMDGAAFARKRAAQNIEMVQKQIELNKRLLQTTEPEDAEYPELMLRLADHYVELKGFYDGQSTALFEKIWEAEDKGKAAEARQLKQQQQRIEKQKREASTNAAKVYGAMIRNPKLKSFKKLDEALYYYAFELGELKQEAEMTKAYQRLIAEYPNSQYIAQGYLAFADYFYGKDQIPQAAQLYERVTQFKDSPVYAFALYKLGWCYLNPLGAGEPRYDKSLSYFIQTIQATLEGRAGSEENAKQLRSDTRRDLIRALVHVVKPSKSWEFATKWGNGPTKDEQDARRMMLLLANQYFGEGKYTESTYIYKQLQDLFADDPERCGWQQKVVVNTLATDDKNIQWKETERLGEVWTSIKDSALPKTVKRQCHDDTLGTMKQMSQVWHDEAIKTKRDETFVLAASAYGKFLELFPDDKDAYESTYYYGELLWVVAEMGVASKDEAKRKEGLANFLKAHETYLKVLEMNPKGKLTGDAAYAQMLALKNHLEYDETGGKAKGCKVSAEGVCIYDEGKKKTAVKVDKNKPGNGGSGIDVERDYPQSDYTEKEKQMLGSYDVYVKYVTDKDNKELPKIMYHRAKLMMEHNKFAEAMPLLEELVTRFDGQLFAAWSAEMLVDALQITWLNNKNSTEETVKAGRNLETWGNKLMKMKTWNHPDADRVRESVPQALAGIGWREGEAYREAGTRYVKGEPGGDPQGFRKCATKFSEVFDAFESHPQADALLWNTAICAQSGYMMKDAISARKVLLETFPASPYAKETQYELAGNYQATAMYAEAAGAYEAFAAKYPADARTSSALTNAALYRIGLGDRTQASADLKKYEDLYKKKDVAKAAGIYWQQNVALSSDDEKLTHALNYIKVYGKAGGADRLAVAHAKAGDILWRRSCPKPLVHGSCIEITRTKSFSGAKTLDERRKLEAKAKRAEQRKSKRFVVPDRCGEETHAVVIVHDRDKKTAADAQKHFSEVIKLGHSKIEVGKEDFVRANDYRNALGMAMVSAADQKYEQYLRLVPPTNLSFIVEDWRKGQGVAAWDRLVAKQEKDKNDSIKRLKDYIVSKSTLSGELKKAYSETKETKSPFWVLAGAARVGMIARNFADQLYRAEVPDEFKSEEQYLAYCDQLSDQARPFEEEARQAFEYCLVKSTENQYFNDFSTLCEAEMQQLDADKNPATAEYFGTSIYSQSRVAPADVMTNINGQMQPELKRNSGATPPAETTDAEAGAAEGANN